MLHGVCHAGDQPAAADGHDDGLRVTHLLEDLKADGALPCDHFIVVERVDEGRARFLLAAHGGFISVVVCAVNEADLSAEALCGFHLADGRAVRHEHDAFCALPRGSKRNALRMVARTAGDDAGALLFIGQLADFVIGAAQLETAGDLQVLGFQVKLRIRAEVRRVDEVRPAGDLLEHERGMVDLVKCQHGVFPFRQGS